MSVLFFDVVDIIKPQSEKYMKYGWINVESKKIVCENSVCVVSSTTQSSVFTKKRAEQNALPYIMFKIITILNLSYPKFDNNEIIHQEYFSYF